MMTHTMYIITFLLSLAFCLPINISLLSLILIVPILHLRVIDGMDVVDKIEMVGSSSGKTSAKVVIKECGELMD